MKKFVVSATVKFPRPPSEAVNMAALNSRLCKRKSHLGWQAEYMNIQNTPGNLTFAPNSPLFLCDHHLDCFFGGWKMVTYHGRIHKQSPKKQTKDDWSLIHALPCRWRPPMLPPMWLLQLQHWRHCLHYDHASREKQGERHEKRGERHEKKQPWSFSYEATSTSRSQFFFKIKITTSWRTPCALKKMFKHR